MSHELWTAVFLVAAGVIVLLLVLMTTLWRLRRLLAERAALQSEWADGTSELKALVNSRNRPRDERESKQLPPARERSARPGAA